jgi:hypothetical protein
MTAGIPSAPRQHSSPAKHTAGLGRAARRRTRPALLSSWSSETRSPRWRPAASTRAVGRDDGRRRRPPHVRTLGHGGSVSVSLQTTREGPPGIATPARPAVAVR